MGLWDVDQDQDLGPLGLGPLRTSGGPLDCVTPGTRTWDCGTTGDLDRDKDLGPLGMWDH